MAAKEASRTSRVQQSYQQLSVASNILNTASDKLSKSIVELEGSLRRLGLGITSWVAFTTSHSREQMQYSFDEVGYAKSGGKWGLHIRTRSGHEGMDEDDVEQWPFNEAPRALRVRAVAKIPNLLDELVKDATAAAKNIAEKAAEVEELSAAMNTIPREAQSPQTEEEVDGY